MSKRIYLAAPYTDPCWSVRQGRFICATTATAELMRLGFLVYSPLTHGHELASRGELPGDFAFWEAHCLSFIQNWAESLCVLPLLGWEASRGVQAEMAEAKRIGLPIHFLEVSYA